MDSSVRTWLARMGIGTGSARRAPREIEAGRCTRRARSREGSGGDPRREPITRGRKKSSMTFENDMLRDAKAAEADVFFSANRVWNNVASRLGV